MADTGLLCCVCFARHRPHLIPASDTPCTGRKAKKTYSIVLLRHGESQWNQENKFTGWVDVPLSAKGHHEAAAAGKLLHEQGFNFDVAFTSRLKRAITTLWHVLEEMDLCWIPVHHSWRLNERHYGALQGLNKAETAALHGEQQVLIWRRAFDISPPALTPDSPMWPARDPRYADVPEAELPATECLATCMERAVPFWLSDIVPAMQADKRVLVAAHGNSLRSIIKYLEGMSDEAILELNIPTGVPLLYELDEEFRPIQLEGAIAPLSGRYIGDPADVQARIDATKNQGKKK